MPEGDAAPCFPAVPGDSLGSTLQQQQQELKEAVHELAFIQRVFSSQQWLVEKYLPPLTSVTVKGRAHQFIFSKAAWEPLCS